VETVLGDARMSLEQELREHDDQAGYDLILLDAFSSDAVPGHLLTVEAFELYRAHLRDNESAILVNISNRFLDFEPLMDGVAEHFGMQATLFIDVGNPPVPTGSLWVLLAEPGSQLAGLVPPIQTYRPEGEAPAPTLLWTDAHSDIFRLLRKYADQQMSVADACLVRMAELNERCQVFTTDRDFRVYRRKGRHVIPLLAPFEP